MIENNDNLEKYFRSQFNKNPEPAPWNTPDEAVWEQIASTLKHKENKSHKLIWIPILSSLILLGILLFTLALNTSKNSIIEKLQIELVQCQNNTSSDLMLSDNKQQLKKDEDTRQFKKPEGNPSFYLSVPQLKSNKNEKITFGVTEKLIDKSFHSLHNDQSENSDFQNQVKAQSYPQEDSAKALINLKSDFSDNSSSDRYNSQITGTDSTQLMKADFILISVHDDVPDTINKKKSYSNSIGLAFGTTHWFGRSTGISGSNTSFQNEYYTPSFHTGIALRKKLSDRLTLESGVSMLKRSLHTSYLIGVHYAHQNESIAPDGSIDYHLDHNLETGMGTINVEMLLNREESAQVMQDELVNMEFSVKSEGTIIEWPANLLWHPISKSGLYINVGVVSQLVLDRSIEVTNYLSHHDIVHEKHAGVKFTEYNYTNLTLAGNFGAGYNLMIGKSWSLNIGASYRKALISSYKTDQSKLRIDQLHSGLAIFKSF